MAIKQLTDAQVRTMSVEEKDRWWLQNVYQGDVPQFTFRAVACGFLLGGVLSITNLYVGAKTGWALGVGITSVILAYLIFRTLQSLNWANNYHVLENNIMQSIACSAGYTNGPLFASMAAYMVIQNVVIPWWQMMLWCFGLTVMGVLFAFPLKRRYINDEQLPFPEGQAAGVVLDALHSEEGEDEAKRVLPAKLLVIFGVVAAGLKFLQSKAILGAVGIAYHVPEMLDAWYYRLAGQYGWALPRIRGVRLDELTVQPELDIAMIGAGGLMGIRTGVSLMIGAVLNYVIIVPWIIERGDIHAVVDGSATEAWITAVIGIVTGAKAGNVGAIDWAGALHYGFKPITTWALWCGVTMMTTASLVAFFSKPATLLKPLKALFRRSERTEDCLQDIELPLWVSVVGVPVIGAGLVYMAWAFYGVPVWMSTIAVPMVFVFTLIAVNSTALTSITPTGAMGKITQLTYGAIAPGQIRTNIVTACISAEVSSSASNLIQNIKPGYMLGGKPRLQAIGHIIGGVAGSLASVAIFYAIFLRGEPSKLISEQYPYPAATAWKAVAEILTRGLSELPVSAQWAALYGGIAGILLEIVRVASKGKFPISPVGIGLAFIIPFTTCLAMFAGSFMFWLVGRMYPQPEQRPNVVLVQNQESICAGIIAGAALMGVAVMATELFVVPALAQGGSH